MDGTDLPRIRGGLQFLTFTVAAVIFLGVGGARAFHLSNDFVPVYTGARCLLHGCNPYKTDQLEREFYRAGGRAEELPSWEIDVPVYPPSTFLVLAPLAALRYSTARSVWFFLNSSLFLGSAILVILVCPASHRWLAVSLASFILATSGILLVLGQPAALAISLVIISSCLFLRRRLLGIGAVMYALSLALKPQIGLLIVVYLLSQQIYRRYAASALAGSLGILIVASLLLHAHSASTLWVSDLRDNLRATLGPGGSADPRPDNVEAVGDTNLQALTSVIFNKAQDFNTAAYATFLGLTILFVLSRLRAGPGYEGLCLSIGMLSVLTLTPAYHRFYDTRLLLLTVPATVALFTARRSLGLVATGLTLLSVISIQYRVQQFLLIHGKWQGLLQSKLLFIVLLRQQNLELLIVFSIYSYAAIASSWPQRYST